jgi:DNA modification methylase
MGTHQSLQTNPTILANPTDPINQTKSVETSKTIKTTKTVETVHPPYPIHTGDLFQLGKHRLICGDAKDISIVAKLLGTDRISLILTDPPYGVAYVESKSDFGPKLGKNKVIANDHAQSEEEYARFTTEWLQVVKPYLGKKNATYIFNSDKMLFALKEGMKQSGFKFAQLLIWIKNHAVMGRMNYIPQHELIAYGWHGTHEFMKSQDKSVLFYPKPNKSPLHPTMKPVGLVRRLILNSTRIGDTVYDPFGGSGTSIIACEQTKRRCLMIELDPEYCQTIITRYQQLTGIVSRTLTGNPATSYENT